MPGMISDAFAALRGVIGGAARPEQQEPGPGDVLPSAETKKRNLIEFEMPPDEVRAWWKRVEAARQRVKAREEKWDILLNEYLPIVDKSGSPETVKVMQHFRNVHSKIGQLFYRSPDLVLTPDDPSMLNMQMPNPQQMPGGPPMPPLTMKDVVMVKQQVLKKKLGRDGIKANRLIDELLFDILAWAGIGAFKVGYRCVFREIPDPMMEGSVLGLSPTAPQIPVPVFEEWYARRISPKKVLWNADLRSSRFDEDATWMGMEFFMSPRMAMRMFKLTEDQVAKTTRDDRVFKYAEDASTGDEGLVHGVEIWCRSAYFTDEVHPKAINQLVLIEGLQDQPVIWRRSPDQDFDPATGQLTKDSLENFPIRVMTIRDLADSPFPPSDSAFTNSEIKQLTTYRRQSIKLRDKAIGKIVYDSEAFDPETADKLKSPDIEHIPVQSGSLRNGIKAVIDTVTPPHLSQDDYQGQSILQADINQTLGVSENSAGSFTSTVRTATEAANVQANMRGRNGKELARVIDTYLDLARMVDQLLMRYADQQDYVEITGPDGAKRMQMWNGAMISGRYLYDIAPDSSLQVDSATDFQLDAQHWNLVAKSPLTNQAYLLGRLAQRRGLDPEKAVMPPQMMEKPEPEKGKFSLALNGMDLANPLVIKMLVDNGIIQAEDAALNRPTPPPPEGAADKADVLSQHVQSNSGRRENEPGASDFRGSQAK